MAGISRSTQQQHDAALFKAVWIQQGDGTWNKVLVTMGNDGSWKTGPRRILEKNVSNKEYFQRKLAGIL